MELSKDILASLQRITDDVGDDPDAICDEILVL
eukprot:CAMPEP_0170552816 /NCGR_PEP_ID=MMETSP0211-20121228/10715_1 /TAXON_ID=311385 /ORGANISM="Pseudokeronopsis sp., Strain OXSARD2" /LENGTH=32 /DNA_ID= /DNA_START= /DNA_END= /DNA_ORIENTATION=